MTIVQLIDERLSEEARRAISLAAARTRTTISAAAAYAASFERAYRMTREFRRQGG
jgi:hypothetical protein